MIKPIQTYYNGYHFRSRLEARWAVFFTKCTIPFEYEPDGYFVNGRNYLPDFYLPWYDCFVEIKPKEYENVAEITQTLEALSRATEKPTILCLGDPVDDCMNIFCLIINDSGGWEGWERAHFVEGARYLVDDLGIEVEIEQTKHWISLGIGDKPKGKIYASERLFFKPYSGHPIPSTFDYASMTGHRWLFETEKLQARQARFEHGETP